MRRVLFWLPLLAAGKLEVPGFLDCTEAAGFSPKWASFRQRAVINAALGWPLDPHLALLTAQLLEEFDDVSTGRSWIHPAGAVWESFRTAEQEGSEEPHLISPELEILPHGSSRGLIFERSRGAERGHVCLYGLATALFIAYRHAVPRKTEDALRHLELILWLLGETRGENDMKRN